jgi:hypothetical protein
VQVLPVPKAISIARDVESQAVIDAHKRTPWSQQKPRDATKTQARI